MPDQIATITLTLEESGILLHLLMSEAIKHKPNPLIDPQTPIDHRLRILYSKLHQANEKLMKEKT